MYIMTVLVQTPGREASYATLCGVLDLDVANPDKPVYPKDVEDHIYKAATEAISNKLGITFPEGHGPSIMYYNLTSNAPLQ